MKAKSSITTRLQRLEEKSLPPAASRPVFRFIIDSAEEAQAADQFADENPDALILRIIITHPPERDLAGNITAPAWTYAGPIERAA